MGGVRHQTVVLARGRHRHAGAGVCAMELSSMLAEERFTDHPQSVCPVVAAFLRGYNDALNTRMRQELFGIAASVVGSRSLDPAVREARAAALHGWTFTVWRDRPHRLPWPPVFPQANAFGDLEAAGAYVGRAARRRRDVHDRTVAFVESLLEAGPPADPDPGGARGVGAVPVAPV
jgi:hypothetical protein